MMVALAIMALTVCTTAQVQQTVWLNSAFTGANSTSVATTFTGTWAPHAIVSTEIVATLSPNNALSVPQGISINCSVVSGTVRFWIDDHLFCDEASPSPPPDASIAPLPPFMALTSGQTYFLRLQYVKNSTSVEQGVFSVEWAPMGLNATQPSASSFSVFSSEVLRPPALDHPQLQRIALQRSLANGWGTWHRQNALSATLLPEGATITAGLCQISTASCLDPTAAFTPEQGPGPEEPRSKASSRPGSHAWDRSYWQLYLDFNGLNVSLEWIGTNGGRPNVDQQLSLLATVVDGNASDFQLTLTGSYVYDRAGSVELVDAISSKPLKFLSTGNSVRNLTFNSMCSKQCATTSNVSSNTVNINLSGTYAAISTTYSTLSAVKAAVLASRQQAVIHITNKTSDVTRSLDVAVTAMQSCLMWNVLYEPLQAAPFVQVSRSFTFYPYEIFEWDTYFGAIMMSAFEDSLPIAISSIIEVTKSKTLGPKLDGHGFVPGYNKGGRWLAEDRTERPIGALVLLQVYKRWQPLSGSKWNWVLDLLFQDLVDWQDWMWHFRRVKPIGLAVPGSDPCFTPGTNKTKRWCKPSWGMGQLQGARFESLDNSPMYDAPAGYELWDPTIYRMRLFDVGQSSAIVWELNALIEIASILNKDETIINSLKVRRTQLSDLIASKMWDNDLGIFSNVLFNGSLYPRISPTSFYPMLAGIATDSQVTRMVTQWLTNKNRFCVPTSPSAWPWKNESGCYWGVPSISADDPDFLIAGGTSGIYWRGETWEPQVYLVYLGLLQYDHIPEVQAARQGLCIQQQDLLLSIWNSTHHVCENYAPTLDQMPNECTGNHFYMWGGLGAFIGLLESGGY